MRKLVVRLKVEELKKAGLKKGIKSNKELAEALNMHSSQIWRLQLPVSDPRYNSPGNQFIAGVMKVFGARFDKYFYIEEVDDLRETKSG